jgi:6-phosphogluconate dehydrogenase
MDAYQCNPLLVNLLLDESFRNAVELRQASWRFVIQTAVGLGIPVMALSTSLAYFDAYRSERLPANLTQAQRDYYVLILTAELTAMVSSIQNGLKNISVLSPS